MGNIVTLNGKEISLISIGKTNNLTDKQQMILDALYDCMQKNVAMNWDVMVGVYKNANGYPKEVEERFYDRNLSKWSWRMVIKDPSISYKNKDDNWIYWFKPKIRQWFATNMGSMILKGAILALPVIEID